MVPGNVPRKPSEHYANTLSMGSPALARLVSELIDGHPAQPDYVELHLQPISESPIYSRITAHDEDPNAKASFVVDLWSRTDNGSLGEWDGRGTPSLLTDVRQNGTWQLFNCCVAVRPFDRADLYAGKYPDP
ncbi:hypothetical protein GORHZ_006_00280 [Gordonia rhizosphera NBRC 16068]|uniref:Uncharacterized protein n=1 Tax=Gordonia rhizosphera NBRC 16068 TaxID=1108045 RepID=K6WNP7_9ACTN|nr:hypothetical protein GORHZ_006_00280 [Gordonia rhizosphera NBRC 16068]